MAGVEMGGAGPAVGPQRGVLQAGQILEWDEDGPIYYFPGKGGEKGAGRSRPRGRTDRVAQRARSSALAEALSRGDVDAGSLEKGCEHLFVVVLSSNRLCYQWRIEIWLRGCGRA